MDAGKPQILNRYSMTNLLMRGVLPTVEEQRKSLG
jgi:hypothetical protein